VVDAPRVLPDVPQPLAPEMLLDLKDIGEAGTLFSPFFPATPPLLGLSSLSTSAQWLIMNLGSIKSSASSSPSIKLEDFDYSSASSSSIQSNQLSLGLFEAADLHVSICEDTKMGVSTPGSEQENVWPDLGLSLPDRPIPSLSRRRMASNIPDLRFQLGLPPGPLFSFTNSGCDFDASSISVETGSFSLAGNQFPYLSCHDHSAEPITPIDQIIHTPDLPPQVLRCDKRSAYQSRCAEKDGLFSQSVAGVPPLSPYGPYPSSHLLAAAEYSSSKPNPFHMSRAQNYSFPSSPLASFHAGVQSASSCLVPESCQDATQAQEITHLAQLPRRLSYPCDARLLDLGLSLRMTSAAYSYASEENNMASTLGSSELAPPAVIRPFFTSDFPGPDSGSSPHTPLDE
jgi:hypothetical protein